MKYVKNQTKLTIYIRS